MKGTTLLLSMQKEIDKIEKLLYEALKIENKELKNASASLLKAGGKRVRPILVLLSGHLGDRKNPDLHKIAVVLELVHMASLIHDDVIDDAQLRRGEPTVYATSGSTMAMSAGNFVFSRALIEVSKINKPEAHRVLSAVLRDLCLGEIDQIRDKYILEQNLRNYLRRIARKTAILISASCELGGIASEATKKDIRHLKLFGYYLGMSYQIMDDILDFTGSEKTLGKPAGEDLRHGNITLPTLYAMKNLDLKKKIATVNEDIPQDELDEILDEIRLSGGIEYSYLLSDRYYDLAYRELNSLSKEQPKEALRLLAEKIRKRSS